MAVGASSSLFAVGYWRGLLGEKCPEKSVGSRESLTSPGPGL